MSIHNWLVRSDGSFDLGAGPWSLLDAYPAIDGIPIRPLSITLAGDQGTRTIQYDLSTGSLTLILSVDGSLATIQARLSGQTQAPRTVEVLGYARMRWATRIFRQGRGMCGGSGIHDLVAGKKLDSTAMVSLLGCENCGLTLWVADQSKFETTFLTGQSFDENDFRVSASCRTEGIFIPEDGLLLPVLKVAVTDDPQVGMRQATLDIAQAMSARETRPASYHWCSWYYLYHNLDMPTLGEYLHGFSQMTPKPDLDYLQIDAGYFPSLGDWLLPSARFPDGLQPAFAKIKEAGYRPGIWVGPFMVGNRSKLYQDRPEWILRDLQGNPVTPWRTYGEPKTWGYRDEESFALDTSHPDAMEYLRLVFRTLKSWGAEMFKTDFMYWGFHDSTTVQRHTPGKTSTEYFREALSMIREEIGPDTFWLGCIAPFFPFVGYADAMRIGGDVGAHWDVGFGPKSMLQETIGNQHLNQILWQNDPDVLLLRDFHSDLTPNEVRTLALWQAIMGGVVATSDPLHELAPDRLALWNFVRPLGDKATARLPFILQTGRPSVAIRTITMGIDVVLVINQTDATIRDRLTFEELSIEEPRFIFSDGHDQGEGTTLEVNLAPHKSSVYILSRESKDGSGERLLW